MMSHDSCLKTRQKAETDAVLCLNNLKMCHSLNIKPETVDTNRHPYYNQSATDQNNFMSKVSVQMMADDV